MLLDFLYPKTCIACARQGSYFCSSCIREFPVAGQICPMCRKWAVGGVTHDKCRTSFGMDGLVNVFAYRGAIQDAIKRIKYRFVRDMGISFVELAVLRSDDAICRFFLKKRYTIVSIPLSKPRQRWRGFNQAELLGRLLAEKWKVDYKDMLLRVKNTDALAEMKVRLSKEEKNSLFEKYKSITQRKQAMQGLLKEKKEKLRRSQMLGAFEVKEKNLVLERRKLLLVDDVWTSGATMLECAKILKRSGADSVWGFTFARS